MEVFFHRDSQEAFPAADVKETSGTRLLSTYREATVDYMFYILSCHCGLERTNNGITR
jgi:hypothetical protein